VEDGVAMGKLSALALVVLACWTADAGAIEIKNVRATYGPFGAPRPDNKMLPGDVYMVNFDITSLNVDARGSAKYEISLEVLDPKGKQIVKEQYKKGVVVGLGGNTVPEFVHVIVGADQAPGKYKVMVTVAEADSKSPPKQLVEYLEVQPKAFGFIFVSAPAVGLTGQDYMMEYSLVGMSRDAKNIPKVTVTTSVLDENGKSTVAEPMPNRIPDDAPDMWANIGKQELLRVQSPIYLNRPGRFTVQIEARDELSKQTKKYSYTLRVLDPTSK
jgi:hypothetical protein